MRLWLQVTLSAAALSIAAPASAQNLLATSEDAHQVASQYVLVNRNSDKDVGAAGSDGYAVVAVPQSLATSILMKRDERGPRSYRSVSTSGLKSFVKGLNEAAAAGFRLVPASVQGTAALLVQQTDGVRFTYSAIEGTGIGITDALADATKRGLVRVNTRLHRGLR